MTKPQSASDKFRIVIYNPNSFGGNHEYAIALSKAYGEHESVISVALLMPLNSNAQGNHILKILLPDVSPLKNSLLKKLYFVYRSFVNPLRLYKLLRRSSTSVVIFNDFDQITAFFWSRLIASLKRKHLLAVILHDPDRDQYSPYHWLSVKTMQSVMRVMDIGFYHGILPAKPYYANKCLKVEIPHGIFDAVPIDSNFKNTLLSKKKDSILLGVLGNIREEKNYDLILDSMQSLSDCQLLIAGQKANSRVPVERYRRKILKLGGEDKVVWVEKFLDESELHAAITACDIIVMYYSKTFQSQSGILNVIAPYRKKLLISDTGSALQKAVASFNLGVIVPADDKNEFIKGIELLKTMDSSRFESGWNEYSKYANWSSHADIAISKFKLFSRKS